MGKSLNEQNGQVNTSVPDPDLDPPGFEIFTPNLEICFENALKSEKIHHNFIHNSSKIQKVKDFNPFVSCC